MKVQINAPYAINDVLRSLIEEKVGKLQQFHPEIVSAEVFLKLEEGRHALVQSHRVDVRMVIPGPDAFASGQADSVEKALAEAVDAVKVQLKKIREKASM